MTERITLDDTAIADIASEGPPQTTAADIAYHRLLIVNVIFLGAPESSEWVLVYAGIPGSASFIKRAARERFGDNERPVAIGKRVVFRGSGWGTRTPPTMERWNSST